ncbi:MAG: P-loop NTPase [Deltaproteobacteria bacterium]|nr:P-loop NTPase [Deltaproteobacteria bacterium]
MKIAVAGAKGGVGKTLVATALAQYLGRSNHRVVYCDADVEGPNGKLFLHPDIERVHPGSVTVPMLNAAKCSGCGTCQSICAFNAILAVGKKVMVFSELCHSCEACFIACADGMLTRHNRHVGNISMGMAGNIRFFEGALNVGEARVAPLVSQVVHAAVRQAADYIIIDNPPGTSCAAVAGQEDADVVVLVTEPTPFGLHDLKLALALGRRLNKSMLVVLNRADLGDDKDMMAYLASEAVDQVARIPFDRQIAVMTADGKSPLGYVPAFDEQMHHVAAAIHRLQEAIA